MRSSVACLLLGPLFAAIAIPVSAAGDGSGRVQIRGELKQWHKITVELAGPFAEERSSAANPFTDYRFDVTLTHPAGLSYTVPGYFAADGDAANTSAKAGNVWRAHFAPDRTGEWSYRVSFRTGPSVAIEGGGRSLAPFDGKTGSFRIGPSDKTGRDFRARGRLEYVDKHYLRFAGTGEFFLKAGPDSPETLLAYADFDDTVATKPNAPLKTWAPHEADWRSGDPTWQSSKGKGLIGALNYLASKGLNTISFLPYNAGGDGDNVWPFISRNEKLRYDCSKLDQWGIVFDHAQALGLHLHFKLQENEMDDNRLGPERRPAEVPESLDNGALGPERKLFLRELIARFGHALALNWNLGEENTQPSAELRAMAQFIRETHYWPSNIVVHTFTHELDRVYEPLLGRHSVLTGASLQNEWAETHQWTLRWVRESARAGRPWVVANDEQGHWAYGVPPDPGYAKFDGTARAPERAYTLNDIRKLVLWGNLMAGGAGVEYYFGYALPENDINAEDFRSREQSWEYCRIALEFVVRERIPFWEMRSADELVGNSVSAESRYCFAKPGELYLVYLPWGGPTTIDLSAADGAFAVHWFNPRAGGPLVSGPVISVTAGGWTRIGVPPGDEGEDWLIVIRRKDP
jgi:hypothetical protein